MYIPKYIPRMQVKFYMHIFVFFAKCVILYLCLADQREVWQRVQGKSQNKNYLHQWWPLSSFGIQFNFVILGLHNMCWFRNSWHFSSDLRSSFHGVPLVSRRPYALQEDRGLSDMQQDEKCLPDLSAGLGVWWEFIQCLFLSVLNLSPYKCLPA